MLFDSRDAKKPATLADGGPKISREADRRQLAIVWGGYLAATPLVFSKLRMPATPKMPVQQNHVLLMTHPAKYRLRRQHHLFGTL